MKDLSKYVSVTHRRSQVFYTEHFQGLGISSGQFMYIICICEYQGYTQDEISQQLIIDKSTVAKVLSKLEENGFITKTINSNDRRAYNIFPTDKALIIYPKILEIKVSVKVLVPILKFSYVLKYPSKTIIFTGINFISYL